MYEYQAGNFVYQFRRKGSRKPIEPSLVLLLQQNGSDWICAKCVHESSSGCLLCLPASPRDVYVDVLSLIVLTPFEIISCRTISLIDKTTAICNVLEQHRIQYAQRQATLKHQKQIEQQRKKKMQIKEQQRRMELQVKALHHNRAAYAKKYELAVINNDTKTIKAIERIFGCDPRLSFTKEEQQKFPRQYTGVNPKPLQGGKCSPK